jgi:hypothetical protein
VQPESLGWKRPSRPIVVRIATPSPSPSERLRRQNDRRPTPELELWQRGGTTQQRRDRLGTAGCGRLAAREPESLLDLGGRVRARRMPPVMKRPDLPVHLGPRERRAERVGVTLRIERTARRGVTEDAVVVTPVDGLRVAGKEHRGGDRANRDRPVATNAGL